ncbi:MAG: hypothetical protein CL908_05630, partial [Deltaproteobacteria bacterium]|nr:hypothetical protein [Deltaproteobacteria bacterium]
MLDSNEVERRENKAASKEAPMAAKRPYTIIDSDSHVTEAADLWTSRVPAHLKDRVPRVEWDSEKQE